MSIVVHATPPDNDLSPPKRRLPLCEMLPVPDASATPERALLILLIATAIDDHNTPTRIGSYGAEREQKINATRWLDGEGDPHITYAHACHLLGLDAPKLREAIRQHVERFPLQGFPTHAFALATTVRSWSHREPSPTLSESAGCVERRSPGTRK